MLTVLSERQFQDQVVTLARYYGWRVYHTYDSRRSAAGFPDLVMAKPGRPIIFAELKRQDGKVGPEQQDWLEVLAACAGNVVSRVFRPSDWPEIERMLGQ